MQVTIVFVMVGQTASGEQEVVGVFDSPQACRYHANDTTDGFQHGNPFVGITLKPTAVDYPEFGGDSLSLQWDDSTNQWELA